METYRVLVMLHLLGATIWVGGHLVLALTVLPRAMRAHDPAIVRDFESGYERLGIPALLLQIVTGIWLAQRWIPNAAGWFLPATPQAWLIVAKLALLVATAVLGAHARLRIIPKLDADRLPALRAHIVAITIVAVLFLVLGVGVRTGGLL
jgi:putative copper export protein